MLHAARVAESIGGGYVAVAGGEVLGTCPLPVAGIMSDQPWEVVREQSIAVNEAAASIGAVLAAPFMILAFVGLAGVPDLGLTEKGLIAVATQSFVDAVLTPLPGLVCCPVHGEPVHELFDPRGALVL